MCNFIQISNWEPGSGSCSTATSMLFPAISHTRFCPRQSRHIAGHPYPKRQYVSKAENRDDRDRDDTAEELFRRELQKRGISGTEQSRSTSEKASSSQTQSKETPLSPFELEKFRSQLEESRKLNSEGLEGLIPRAKQLLTLGVTFFLAFAPVILAISLLFSGIFWLYGDNFIHGGRPNHTPYMDPVELLNEPTADPRIPF